MSDFKHTHVVILCLLVSGTKYSLNIFLNITLFSLFNIIFDWDESNDQVSKPFKETSLRSIFHGILYHIICGAQLYIQLLITDMVSNEK